MGMKRLARALALALPTACAHPQPAPAAPEAPAADPCAEVRRAEQRYADAERACAVFSRETFNWHDCMVAHRVQPMHPPPYHLDDGPDCHPTGRSLQPVAEPP